MRLFVCWSAHPGPPIGGGLHPCGKAHKALRDAGHDPEVVKARGLRYLPDRFNQTRGRREVRKLTGKVDVPVLVLDDGTVVGDSGAIVAWAEANPA